MDLGDTNSAGLQLCGSCEDAAVVHVAQCAVEAIMGRGTAEKLLAGGAASGIRDATTRNRVFAALACTLLEGAKMDSTSEDLRALLTNEHRVSSRQAKALAELYSAHKQELRTLLASNSASSPVPRLVDTHWRMDLDVSHSKDRHMEKKPMYHLTLDLQKATAQAWGGSTAHAAAETSGEVRLALTEEHLQALLAKLNEACRVVEAPTS